MDILFEPTDNPWDLHLAYTLWTRHTHFTDSPTLMSDNTDRHQQLLESMLTTWTICPLMADSLMDQPLANKTSSPQSSLHGQFTTHTEQSVKISTSSSSFTHNTLIVRPPMPDCMIVQHLGCFRSIWLSDQMDSPIVHVGQSDWPTYII